MEKVDFLANDGIALNGILYKENEENEKKEIILAVNGMSSCCFKKRDDIIAKFANKNNIAYFCFNNRGSELVRYIRKNVNGKRQKFLGGTSFEDVLESYEDIVGAIVKLKELGYKNIYLQGHSLGSTKVVYTYNKLLEKKNLELLESIKAIILLSLVDIPFTLKIYLKDNYMKYLKYAEEKEEQGKALELMPLDAFIHPISIKTFLRYARDYKDIDFAHYGEDDKMEKLNNIKVPLFMRWGNDKEMILQSADELVGIIKDVIKNPDLDASYIDGANHGYEGKEDILAKEIISFLK